MMTMILVAPRTSARREYSLPRRECKPSRS
jgi:hypothetical protein